LAEATSTSKSLRTFVLESIGSFLYSEGFTTNKVIPSGILEAIDSLSNYHEEGQELYPEIVLTTDIDAVLLTLPSKTVDIYSGDLSIEGFKKAIKLCAPLAIEGWVIFIEVRNNEIKFGVCTAEISEVSPSLFRQLFSEGLKTEINDTSYAYIRNIGSKTVQLTGVNTTINVSFTLKDTEELKDEKLTELCKCISKNGSEDHKESLTLLFEKLIQEANKVGHGTLIGVIQDENIDRIKTGLDGTFFDNPIDLHSLLKISETENTRGASTDMRQYLGLVRSMINSDGITVFSTSGKVLGYHVFVDLKEIDSSKVVGGARSRAFEAMKIADLFECCFFKSQDGNEKYWNINGK